MRTWARSGGATNEGGRQPQRSKSDALLVPRFPSFSPVRVSSILGKFNIAFGSSTLGYDPGYRVFLSVLHLAVLSPLSPCIPIHSRVHLISNQLTLYPIIPTLGHSLLYEVGLMMKTVTTTLTHHYTAEAGKAEQTLRPHRYWWPSRRYRGICGQSPESPLFPWDNAGVCSHSTLESDLGHQISNPSPGTEGRLPDRSRNVSGRKRLPILRHDSQRRRYDKVIAGVSAPCERDPVVSLRRM